jgi:hypothetical protein
VLADRGSATSAMIGGTFEGAATLAGRSGSTSGGSSGAKLVLGALGGVETEIGGIELVLGSVVVELVVGSVDGIELARCAGSDGTRDTALAAGASIDGTSESSRLSGTASTSSTGSEGVGRIGGASSSRGRSGSEGGALAGGVSIDVSAEGATHSDVVSTDGAASLDVVSSDGAESLDFVSPNGEVGKSGGTSAGGWRSVIGVGGNFENARLRPSLRGILREFQLLFQRSGARLDPADRACLHPHGGPRLAPDD